MKINWLHQVVVGEVKREYRLSLLAWSQWCEREGVEHIITTQTNRCRKTLMLDKWNPVFDRDDCGLIVDADTIPSPKLTSDYPGKQGFLAVYDLNGIPDAKHRGWYGRTLNEALAIVNGASACGERLATRPPNEELFNGGVAFVKPLVIRDVIRLVVKLREANPSQWENSQDQALLNVLLWKSDLLGILPRCYNCTQPIRRQQLCQNLSDTLIWHFCGSHLVNNSLRVMRQKVALWKPKPLAKAV